LSQLDQIVDIATKTLIPGHSPFRDVPIPVSKPRSSNNAGNLSIVPAVWTRDALKPRWNNLATFVDTAVDSQDIDWWMSTSRELRVPLVVLATEDHCLLIPQSPNNDPQRVAVSHLREELEVYRRKLFSPHVLSSIRGGQLTFADLEDSLVADSFAAQLRHRVQLHNALKDALEGAMFTQIEIWNAKRRIDADDPEANGNNMQSVVEVAIAYLAARILDDKGFFDNRRLLSDDPRALLEQTIGRANGFFTDAYWNHLPKVDDRALQYLAAHLGNSVTFALIDHLDVGRLYEQALLAVQEGITALHGSATPNILPNLQQHYTPVAIATQMLDHLPLERLRPEKRVIYDPTSGSGSLLLAATRRLALMPDIASSPQGNTILASHVLGNDLDSTSRLITKLRYTLVQQTFAPAHLFPDPNHIGNKDYKEESTWNLLPLKPNVVVANPPFLLEDGKQSAVVFVNTVLKQLPEGAQFAFVLPDVVLRGEKYGWPDLRRKFAKECRILEMWQLPEGVVGLSANQAVSVVIGTVGNVSPTQSVIARSIVSRAHKNAIRDWGFLGNSWIGQVDASLDNWSALTAPQPSIKVPTIEFGKLFYTCVGITLKKEVSPISAPVPSTPTKRYWKHSWKTRDSLWADPNKAPFDERYIRYSPKFLKHTSAQNEVVFDSTKVMLSRITNRASNDPFLPCFDTEGLCPNNNVICVVPLAVEKLEKLTERSSTMQPFLTEWLSLEREDQLLWLLGILSSDIAPSLTAHIRSTRHITTRELHSILLPAQIDKRIPLLAKQILTLDREQEALIEYHSSERPALIAELNAVVRESYGNVAILDIQRTGKSPEIESWLKERTLPTSTAIGRVSAFDPLKRAVYLCLEGMSIDDQDEWEGWLPLPAELPGWALDGTVFEVEISEDVQLFSDLGKRPWAMRNVRHTPRPYLSIEELEKQLVGWFESGV
jgi:hypothetical protein